MLAIGDIAEHCRAAFAGPPAVLASVVPQDAGAKCRWVEPGWTGKSLQI